MTYSRVLELLKSTLHLEQTLMGELSLLISSQELPALQSSRKIVLHAVLEDGLERDVQLIVTIALSTLQSLMLSRLVWLDMATACLRLGLLISKTMLTADPTWSPSIHSLSRKQWVLGHSTASRMLVILTLSSLDKTRLYKLSHSLLTMPRISSTLLSRMSTSKTSLDMDMSPTKV